MWSSSKTGGPRGPALLAFVALLVLGGALALLADARSSPRTESAGQSRAFLSATGGFGLGSSVSTDWSVHVFDPRIEGLCENELWPLPGSACPNPGHGTGLANLPPLD